MRGGIGWIAAGILAWRAMGGDWSPVYAPADLDALMASFKSAWAQLGRGEEPPAAPAADPEALREEARRLALRRIALARDYRARLVALRHYAGTADDDAEVAQATAEIERMDKWLGEAEAQYAGAPRAGGAPDDPLPGGLEDQLVLHCAFDAEPGPGIREASPREHRVVNHGARWVAQGRQGGAYWFDGTDDYLDVPAATSFWQSTGMTISLCVFRHAAEDVDESYVARGDLEARDLWIGVGMDHRAHAGIRHSDRAAGVSSEDHVASSQTVPGSRWMHLTATYDGVLLRLFVNGRLDSQRVAPGGIADSRTPLCIGRSGPGRWRYGFMGVMDDLIVWERALSEVEVLGLHAWLFGPPANP